MPSALRYAARAAVKVLVTEPSAKTVRGVIGRMTPFSPRPAEPNAWNDGTFGFSG
jgi:hypothetical protein